MKSFNVVWWDFNKSAPEPYDIMPYLVQRYNEISNKPETFDEFKEFIKRQSLSQWWSRCEYEVILSPWPVQDKEVKIDIHSQVMMNLDIITSLLMEEVNGNSTKKIN